MYSHYLKKKIGFLIAVRNDTVLWGSYFVFHSTNEIVTVRGSSFSYTPNRPLRGPRGK